MPGPVAYVLKGYPRLSETFISQEIRALEQRGLPIHIISLRHPTESHVHPIHREIRAPVTYLPEYVYQEPLRVLRAWWRVRRWPSYRVARSLFWRDLRRDPTVNRLRRFGQALVLARELRPAYTHLHAHFLHTPASVARYAAILRELSWSCSAHAKDIWTLPDWEKQEKLADCRWLVTCTSANADHLARLGPAGVVSRIYHGLDLSRFPPPPPRNHQPDGSSREDPVLILSVGRAVEKKGYPDLLEALAMLPRHLHWQLVHIGGGALVKSLHRMGRRLGIQQRVAWLGAQPQEVVLDYYRRAHIFALACRIAPDGDRDGLPNVLMEASSQQLPVVSTRISAIPELIEDGVNGLLVPQREPAALAEALGALITDPPRRHRLGLAGEERVRSQFPMERGISELGRKFGLIE